MKQLFAMMLLLFCYQLNAQVNDEQDEKRKEKIDKLRRTYISDKLQMTTEQADKFWPIYNVYNDQKEVIKKTIRKSYRKMKEGSMSNDEMLLTLDVITTKRKEEADLDAAFLKQCLPILGTEKTVRLAGLPKEFQKELVERIKEKRQERQPGSPARRN